jgi:hypothetical protein
MNVFPGRHLPGDLKQRVVPRGDQRAHADRFVHDQAVYVVTADVDRPGSLMPGRVAGLGHRVIAVVAEHTGHVVDVVFALDEPLARVKALHPCQRGAIALQQVGDAQQQSAPLKHRRAGPWAGIEGRPGSCDGREGVGFGGFVDLGDQFIGRRTADLATASQPGRHPLPVDIQRTASHARLPPQLLLIAQRISYVATL